MATRQLLHRLPAELRNEVYSHLSTSATTTRSIPLKLKTYTTAHTTVQLCAVHRGSPGLLALRNYAFLEGDEYRAWLLAHGLEVWISVHFTGHLHTYSHTHWAAKTSASLRKLAKKFPWLTTVATYDIRILWEPRAEWKPIARPGKSGAVASAMVGTLLGLQCPTVQRKKADVKAQMCVSRFTQLAGPSRMHLGLETFLVGAGASSASTSSSNQHAQAHREVREVTARCPKLQRHPHPNIGELIDLPSTSTTPPPILISSDGRAAWTAATHGYVVMRRTVEPGRVWRESEDARPKCGGYEHIWRRLWEECAGPGFRGWIRESEKGTKVNRMLNEMFRVE